MGILDWFRSGEGGGSGDDRDPDREVTPGGSVVYHYGREDGVPPAGALDAAQLAENVAGREAVYRDLFGERASVYREVVPLVPHIDVCVYPPGYEERGFYTLVTSGMSDLPMSVPDVVGPEGRRTELVLYVAEPQKDYASLLRFLAHFPHDHHTWLGHGHTMPNGQPALPLFLDSDLDTFLFLAPPIPGDAALRDRLTLGGDPVNLLWVVPITAAECGFKLAHGTDALLAEFERAHHPVTLDERRQSYV